MSKFAPEIVHGDWHTVELALRKIMQKIGPLSEPTFGGLTIDGTTIAAADVGNWNAAYGWGDHSAAGYITSVSGGDHSDLDNLEFALSGHSGFQAEATNLTSLAGLTFVSTSFVKMTNLGTFTLDTNTYLTTESDPVAMGYINQAVKTTSTPTFASLSVTDLTAGGVPYIYTGGLLKYTDKLTFDGTNLFANTITFSGGLTTYKLSSDTSGRMSVQRQSAGLSYTTYYTWTGDGSENTLIQFRPTGDPSQNTSFEQMQVGCIGSSVQANRFAGISTNAAGVGNVTYPIKIFTGTNTSQLVLNTDGSINMSGSLAVSGAVRSGGGFNSDGNDGATANVAVAKVGGGTRTLTFNGGIYIGYADS